MVGGLRSVIHGEGSLTPIVARESAAWEKLRVDGRINFPGWMYSYRS